MTTTHPPAPPHMSALHALTTRASNGKLTEPAPDTETLQLCFAAAARAPDHGMLRPWRVRMVRGEARNALGELMAQTLAGKNPRATPEELDKLRGKALRAPLILMVGAQLTKDHKVPVNEQLLAAAAAAHAILLTLHARGYAGIWRTGDSAYDPQVQQAFGVDAIVGFLYAGTPRQPAPEVVRPVPEDFVSEWSPATSARATDASG